jgi:hypothetical protein
MSSSYESFLRQNDEPIKYKLQKVNDEFNGLSLSIRGGGGVVPTHAIFVKGVVIAK